MKKSVRNTAIGLGLVALIWGAGAIAQDQGGRGGGLNFAELDADGNGSISISEMKAAEDARFAEIDSNGDGIVSVEELTAHATAKMNERMAERFAKMLEWQDTDGDGSLSQAELAGDRGQKMFMRADADNDGEVTAEEFEAAKSKEHGGRRGHGGKGERRGNGG